MRGCWALSGKEASSKNKPEIRNPKAERNPKSETRNQPPFRIWSFGFLSTLRSTGIDAIHSVAAIRALEDLIPLIAATEDGSALGFRISDFIASTPARAPLARVWLPCVRRPSTPGPHSQTHPAHR